MEYKVVKPLFKYIGGKTWLRTKLREKVSKVLSNKEIKYYVEPFAGGLGSFLSVYDVLLTNNISNVVLGDINSNLINLYKHINSHTEELIEDTILLEKGFSKTISIPSDIKHTKEELKDAETYYKEIRNSFNINKKEDTPLQSARLIFLQKHSFNGVYRENSKGDYNTPFNWSPSSMEKIIGERILELAEVFSSFNMSFIIGSYEKHKYTKDSLFYLDPPYLNEKELIENQYNQAGFTLVNQLELIDKIKDTNFIYSNHNSIILTDALSKLNVIEIEYINRKNIMSASASTRADDKQELLATLINLTFD